MSTTGDPTASFIEAACVPLDGGHASGTLEQAQAILAANPDVADSSIHTVAILGDDAAVRRWLELDVRHATARGGPRIWDALTHLCRALFTTEDVKRSAGATYQRS